MKTKILGIAVALAICFGAMPASATGWSTTTMGDPGTIADPLTVIKKRLGDHFFWIEKNTTTASTWILLLEKHNVDICLDADIAGEGANSSTLTVEIMFVPHHNLNTIPTDLTGAVKLLGVTLNGTPSTSGTTNDCIYDVKGGGWLIVTNIVKDDDQDGLVTISHRRF